MLELSLKHNFRIRKRLKPLAECWAPWCLFRSYIKLWSSSFIFSLLLFPNYALFDNHPNHLMGVATWFFICYNLTLFPLQLLKRSLVTPFLSFVEKHLWKPQLIVGRSCDSSCRSRALFCPKRLLICRFVAGTQRSPWPAVEPENVLLVPPKNLNGLSEWSSKASYKWLAVTVRLRKKMSLGEGLLIFIFLRAVWEPLPSNGGGEERCVLRMEYHQSILEVKRAWKITGRFISAVSPLELPWHFSDRVDKRQTKRMNVLCIFFKSKTN